ncbi:hypothetical protein P389DRAFT_86569 [Cystobasidium minutum MCA 4210]|uniref:uncharacterized protein n=1 Tax=Cystobasidium minutum MCA 4210 TaxID=1397322 RepID=UPI0034CDF23E|eukprot:jgi/Rhomi1/86569/CE86568_161
MSRQHLNRLLSSQEGPYVVPLSSQNIREEQNDRVTNAGNGKAAPSSERYTRKSNGNAKEPKELPKRQPPFSHRQFLGALIPVALLILAVFWAVLSHIYGLFYNQGDYTRKGKVAVVDFDGGLFGGSLLEAAAMRNRTYGYPTYAIISAQSTTPEEIRHEVFKGTYWAALYAFPGATDRFEAVLAGTDTEPYDATQTFAYVTLSARYFAFYEFNILTTSITVTSTASGIITERAVGSTLSSRTADSPALSRGALEALGHPAQAIEIPAAYADFALADDKIFVNTIGTVMPVLMQFFFIMAWNGTSNRFHAFAYKRRRDHIKYRLICSTLWPFLTSLCSTGWTFVFKRSYPTDAGQFFGIWAISWLYEMITFNLLDIITAFVPLPVLPLCIVTYVVSSVCASLGPPELVNNWYRVSYFLPSLHWYQVSITIYTRGGVNRLYYNLPVMFSWWVVLITGSIFATLHRVKLGRAALASVSKGGQ